MMHACCFDPKSAALGKADAQALVAVKREGFSSGAAMLLNQGEGGRLVNTKPWRGEYTLSILLPSLPRSD